MFLLQIILLTIGIVFVIIGFFLKFKKKEKKLELSNAQISSVSAPSVLIQKNSIAEVFLFFGTQSGTAERFCNTLAQEAEEQCFKAKVVDLEEYDKYEMKGKNCIFCVATHGEGDPSDNAKRFYKFLKENESQQNNELFKDMKFTVFGLGNKQYQHYNAMGKAFNRLLEKLGGERMYKYGEGDDNLCLEDDFNAWKEGIWEEIKTNILNQKDQKVLNQIKMAKDMEAFSQELQVLFIF
jgi:NADPH-ferrihemoprotein reductase